MSEHVVGVRTYLLVFAALMVLTATTIGAAYVDMGAANTIVALSIALLKATLVALVFMHLRWSGGLIALWLVGGVFFVLHLTMGTFADVATR